MPLAYSYLRMSSAEQIKGDSRRRQLERSRAYADAHGLQLDETLQDLGVSAYHGKNRESGALARFLRLVQQGKVPKGSYLIVENLDRLSRETPRKALAPFLALIDAGIRIVTLSDEKVYDEASLDGDMLNLFASLMVMARANEESKTKSERVGAAWQRKHAVAGKMKVTARCPGWLRLSADRTKFELIADKAAAVRRAFEMTANGIGRQVVARMLNASGVKSPGGGRWYASSLARLLKSDAVLGTYQPHEVRNGTRKPRGEPVKGYYPAVVKPELVQRARAAMAERARGYAGRKGKAHTNLFGGLIYCSCGARMRIRHHGKERHGGPALACSDVVEGGSCEHRRRYNYGKFEAAFLENVREIDLSHLEQQQDAAMQALEAELAAVRLDIAAKTKALRRWTEQFEQDDGGRLAVVADRIRKLGAELEALQLRERQFHQQLDHARATQRSGQEQLATIERLRKRLAKADRDELYRLRANIAQEIRRVVQRITFKNRDDGSGIVEVRTSPKPGAVMKMIYHMRPGPAGGSFAVGRLHVPARFGA